MKSRTPGVIDLFCGVGGLSLGAARAGFVVQGAIDFDRQALWAHSENFPRSVHLLEDVRELTGDHIRSSSGIEGDATFGVIGGPPCQGFSTIGKRNQDDERNYLLVRFFELVREIRPSFFLMENVPGLMHSKNSLVLERALSAVSNDYVILPHLLISANSFGAPTTRTRVFLVGYLPDQVDTLTKGSFIPPAESEDVLVKDALRGLPEYVDPSWQNEADGWQRCLVREQGYFHSRLLGHVPKNVGNAVALHRLVTEGKASGTLGTRHSAEVAQRYGSLRPGETDPISKSRRLEPEGYCPTLRAGTGPEKGSYQAVRPIHPTMPRVITPREAARLQGFPDWFTFSPSKWHSFRQIGNSVSPLVAERLFSIIRASLPC